MPIKEEFDMKEFRTKMLALRNAIEDFLDSEAMGAEPGKKFKEKKEDVR
jgi:hypothetical protein